MPNPLDHPRPAPGADQIDADSRAGRSVEDGSIKDGGALDNARLSGEHLTGGLWLTVEQRDGRNVVTGQSHRGALRLLRPLYLDSSGQPCLTVVNPGGGYVGGDRYELAVTVAAGACALVTTQSATKVYRTPGQRVIQEQTFAVGAGATLEVIPDPLIAYQDADYLQRTHATIAPEARLVLTDVVTPGWAADGTLYRWSSVLLRTRLQRPCGALLAVDTLRLVPDDDAVADHGFISGRTHLGTMLAVAPEIDQDVIEEVHDVLVRAEAQVPGLRAGVTGLSEPMTGVLSGTSAGRSPVVGLAVRVLGPGTEVIEHLLLDVHAALRRRWGTQPRLNLRKY